MIGITESTTAANVGKMKSGKDYGEIVGVRMLKKWTQIIREDMRETHSKVASEYPVYIDDSFHVPTKDGGVNLMSAPGDLTAPAEQRCNCGCVIVCVSENFAKRNFSKP